MMQLLCCCWTAAPPQLGAGLVHLQGRELRGVAARTAAGLLMGLLSGWGWQRDVGLRGLGQEAAAQHVLGSCLLPAAR
jgi:hypothetical protein